MRRRISEKAQAIANKENALVLYIKSNIAIFLHLQGRHPEAIELYLQVYEFSFQNPLHSSLQACLPEIVPSVCLVKLSGISVNISQFAHGIQS